MTTTLPYARESETSYSAAVSMIPHADKTREIVYEYLLSQGRDGATDDEMQEATGLGGNTQRPRRGELVSRGLVRETPNRRKTRSGRPATVWIAIGGVA